MVNFLVAGLVFLTWAKVSNGITIVQTLADLAVVFNT